MTQRTKLFAVMILGLVVYCVMMSMRLHAANPGQRLVLGIVAAISIGIAMVAGLRVGRLRSRR